MSDALRNATIWITSMPTSAPTAAFTTHANYLHAIDKLIAAYVPKPHGLGPRIDRVVEHLIPAVRNSQVFNSIHSQGQRSDHKQLEQILMNAWTTELLLNTTGDIGLDEFIGFSNNWSVIQAYYAAYHAIQAVLVAHGEKRPEKHSSTQRQFTAFWVDRRTDLLPWSLGWASAGAINLPHGYTLQTVHPWENCSSEKSLDFLAMGLRTTREDLVDQRLAGRRKEKQTERRKQWDSEEAARLAKGRKPKKRPSFPLPKLNADERAATSAGVKATSLLDYLYRLRVRSNYEDSTMFTEGPSDPAQSWIVHQELSRITCATMLVHELLVSKIIGSSALDLMMTRWLQKATRSEKSGLLLRYNALQANARTG